MWQRLSLRTKAAVWLIVTFSVFLALLLSVVGIVSLFTAQSRERGTVTFTYGTGSRRDFSVEGAKSAYMPNGVPYADFSRLSTAYPFLTSGDEDEIRYLIEVDEGIYDTVTFYFDSRQAIVNGVHITLSAPVKRYESSVMVPCDFITTYMDGISVEITDEKIRLIYAAGMVSLKPSLHSIAPIG